MNPSDPQSYAPRLPLKYILIVAGVLLIIILAVLFIFYRANNKRVVEKKNIFTNNNFLPGIQSVYTSKSDQNNITVFNGRNFIDYNISTKNSQQLISGDINLPTLSDIRWSKDGKSISFKANKYSFDDDLGKILRASNKSLNDYHYWIYDIKNKKAKLIQSNNSDATALYWSRQDSNAYFFTIRDVNEEGSSLNSIAYRSYNNSNEIQKLFDTTGNIRNITDTSPSNIIALIGDGTNYQVTPYSNGTLQKPITSLNTDIFEVSPDLSNFYSLDISEATDVEEGSADIPGVLNIYSLKDGKKNKTIKDENSSYIYNWNHDGKSIYSFYYQENQAVTRMYDLSKNKEEVLKTPTDVKSPVLISLIPTIKDWLFFFSTDSGIGITSTNNIDKPYTGSLDSIKTQNSTQGFVIGVQNNNTVRINIYNNPVSEYKKKALEYIKSKNVTPDLINFKYDTTVAEEKQ